MSAAKEISNDLTKIIFAGKPTKQLGNKTAIWLDGLVIESDNEEDCAYPLDPNETYIITIEKRPNVHRSSFGKKYKIKKNNKFPWFGCLLTIEEISKRIKIPEATIQRLIVREGLNCHKIMKRIEEANKRIKRL